MNKNRRRQIQYAVQRLEAVGQQVSDLAVEEAELGEGDIARTAYQDKAKARVADWRTIVQAVAEDVDSIKDDEEEAAESVIGEDRKAGIEQAVSDLTEAHEALEELGEQETPKDFLAEWHDSHEDIISKLQDAEAA